MTHCISRALKQMMLLTLPGPTRRRDLCPKASTAHAPAPPSAPAGSRRTAEAPGFFVLLDGEEHDLVRPYVLLHEWEQERKRLEAQGNVLRMPFVGAARGAEVRR